MRAINPRLRVRPRRRLRRRRSLRAPAHLRAGRRGGGRQIGPPRRPLARPGVHRVASSTTEAQIVVLPRLARHRRRRLQRGAGGVSRRSCFGLYDQRPAPAGPVRSSTTMMGGNALAYADDFIRYDGKPPLPAADEDNHGLDALYRLYRAGRGRWVFLAAPRQSEWERLVDALGRPAALDDDRFATAAARAARTTTPSRVHCESIFATRAAPEWEALLVPQRVACVAAFGATHSEFTCTDPVLRETGLRGRGRAPRLRPDPARTAPPVALSETPGRVAPGCLLGQHTDAHPGRARLHHRADRRPRRPQHRGPRRDRLTARLARFSRRAPSLPTPVYISKMRSSSRSRAGPS